MKIQQLCYFSKIQGSSTTASLRTVPRDQQYQRWLAFQCPLRNRRMAQVLKYRDMKMNRVREVRRRQCVVVLRLRASDTDVRKLQLDLQLGGGGLAPCGHPAAALCCRDQDYKFIEDLMYGIHCADCDTRVADVLCRSDLPLIDLPSWLCRIKQRLCKDNTYQYECGGAMLRVSDVAPAPSGHEWRFQCSVGVDCSDVEPRCIWLAVLRGISPGTSPRRTPIASPRRPGFRRAIQRHRLSWDEENGNATGSGDCFALHASIDLIRPKFRI
ncbi:hypothetical protein F2P81_021865 [Scophthalmus maximus]|uniref:Uncharacterized protein n=1 Tax=Scophthalmus maximus TaxID=52904 RepID=A0A6A4S376_SCOMX|nr:hypothetical protein F2P81_021865 [Scophthalmus maximus]